MTGYRDRALEDVIEAERKLRSIAEQTAREYKALMKELAQRLAGEALEARRVDDPGAPDNWKPSDWQAFWWSAAIRPAGTAQAWGVATKPNGNGHDKALQAEVESLRRKVAEMEAERNRLLQEMRVLQAEDVKPKPVEKAEKKGPETTPPQLLLTDELLAPQHREVVRALRTLTIPEPPLRFAEQLRKDESGIRYRRKALLLYVLATTGYCTRLEVDRLIAATEEISVRTNSVRKPANELEETGLVLSQTLHMTSPFETGLALYRLSEDGKALCRAWGWEVVESEWERVLRLHQGETQEAHTIMLLAFALHARLRGWDVALLPEVQGKAVPDVLVERDGERWYVEVERGDGSKRKWKNLAGLNGGKVALCAADENGRRELVSDCKGLKLNGVATDLHTLAFEAPGKPRGMLDITPQMELWVERW